MNTKLLKSLLFFLFLITFSFQISAGETPRITYSPSNPVVGQTVTFTVEDDYTSESCDQSIAVDLFSSNLLEVSDMSNTASHIYTIAGTYNIAYDVFCEFLRSRKTSDRALQQFEFGPTGGPFVLSTSGNRGQFSPLVIAAAPPSSIPTMGEWGLIILGLISMIFGVVFINQKYLVTAKS